MSANTNKWKEKKLNSFFLSFSIWRSNFANDFFFLVRFAKKVFFPSLRPRPKKKAEIIEIFVFKRDFDTFKCKMWFRAFPVGSFDSVRFVTYTLIQMHDNKRSPFRFEFGHEKKGTFCVEKCQWQCTTSTEKKVNVYVESFFIDRRTPQSLSTPFISLFLPHMSRRRNVQFAVSSFPSYRDFHINAHVSILNTHARCV